MKSIIEKFSNNESRSFVVREVCLDYNDPFLHSHDLYELVYLHNCSGKRFIGDNIENFEGDEIAFMGPNLPHCWQISDTQINETPKAVVIHFDKGFFNALTSTVPELSFLDVLSKKSCQGIIFSNINHVNYWDKFKDISDTDSKSLKFIKTMGLFNELIDLDYSAKATEGYSLKSHKKDYERINKVYEFVYSSFHKELKIEYIADKLNLTKTSFCRYFKKMTKKSFSEFVKEVRVSQACKLLIETDQTISQICFQCGYNTVANFNKQFKEITNTNPQAYRDRYN